MAATIKANLELDGSQFQTSVEQAKGSIDGMTVEAKKLADSINDAERAEKAEATTLKSLKKEFNQQKSIIQDCAIKLKILGDAAKDTKGYKDLQQQMQDARAKALQMKEGLDAAKESIDDLRNKSNIEIKLDGLTSGFEGMSDDIKNVTGMMGGLGSSINSAVGGIQTKLLSLTAGFQSLNKILSQNKGGFNGFSTGIKTVISDANNGKGMLGELNTAMSSVGRACGGLGESFANLGIVGKLGWIGAAVAALTALTKVAGEAMEKSNEFAASMSSLSAVTGATGADLSNMKDIIEETGKSMNTNVNDVAKNFELIGSAMPDLLQYPDSLNEVSLACITLGKASGMALDEATNSMTLAMNQFDLGAEEAMNAADILSNGAKYGAASIKDISESLHNCGTAANVAGLDLQQTTALIEVLGSKGLKSAEAGTQLKTMFQKMSTGADEFNPKVVGVQKALQNLSEHADDAQFMLDTFGDSASQAATIIAQNSGAYDGLVGKLNEAGAAADMAAKRGDNLQASLGKLNTAWNNFMASFSGSSSDNWLSNIFTGAVDGITILINAISDLVHAFDPLFALNLSDAVDIDVNPIKDFCQIVADLIELVAQVISSLFDMSDTAESTGNTFGSVFTVISAGFQAISYTIETVTDLIHLLSNVFVNLKNKIMEGVKSIPFFETIKSYLNTIFKWINTVIQAFRDLKKELHQAVEDTDPNNQGGGKGKAPKKQKRQTTNPNDVPDNKKTLKQLEDELTKLNDTQKGAAAISASAYKARKKQLEDLIKTQKKLRGLEDDSKKSGSSTKSKGSSKSTANTPAAGSLGDLEKQLSDLQNAQKNGKLKISTEEAEKKIEALKKKIQDKKYELGLVVPNSLSDLETRLSDLQKRMKEGTLDVSTDEAKKQIKDLETQITQKKFELGLGFKPGSIADLENQISDIEKGLKEGTLDISTDEAYKKIAELKEKVEKQSIELHLEPAANTGDAIESKMQEFVKDYKLGLHPEVSPEEFKKKIKQLEKDIKSANITLGIDLDLDEANKQYKELMDDFNKQQKGGSSFKQAVAGNQPKQEDMSDDDRLDKIEEQMDANDSLIEQLKELQELYSEMGEAGAEGYQQVSDKIKEVNEQQEDLGKEAKTLDKSSKKTKKLAKNFNDAGDAVGSMGSAFSSLGSAFESPELNVAGVIAQGIASVAQGAGEAIASAGELGPWGWIAAVAAIMATMAATVAQVHSLTSGSFASGGIVTGNSRVGDHMLANVNAGELLINDVQLQRLWNIISGSESWNYNYANSGGQVLESRVSGRDLVLCLKNNEKIMNKSGKTLGIKA